MQWFKHDHNTRNDPKLSLVAQKTGVQRGLVYAVWCALMECASDGEARGSITHIDWEAFAYTLDMPEEDVSKVLKCMESLKKPLVTEGALPAFTKRNETSTERVKRFRENKKQSETHETVSPVAQKDETNGNAEKRMKPHREKEEIDKKDTPHSPPKGDGYSKSFLIFWKAYPKKDAKDTAWRAWKKKTKGVDLQTILDALERYKREKPEDVAWKNPATWLNGGCWKNYEDEAGSTPEKPPPECPHRLKIYNALGPDIYWDWIAKAEVTGTEVIIGTEFQRNYVLQNYGADLAKLGFRVTDGLDIPEKLKRTG